MLTQTADASRIIAVRMNPGEDLLEGICAGVRESGLANGAILSGAGSLSSYHVHVVKTTELPPGNVFFSEEGAFDILTLTGLVIDGRVHAHITFSNPEKAMGGHLEEGCRVLTFAFAIIADTPDADFTDWDRTREL